MLFIRELRPNGYNIWIGDKYTEDVIRYYLVKNSGNMGNSKRITSSDFFIRKHKHIKKTKMKEKKEILFSDCNSCHNDIIEDTNLIN